MTGQDSELDIYWPLDDGVTLRVTRKAGDIYVIQDVNSDRQLTLSWKHDGTDVTRLLFDGQDIETESYMAYLGLMDDVVEQLSDNGIGTVIFDETSGSVTVLKDGES